MTTPFIPVGSRQYRQMESYRYLFKKIEESRIPLSLLPRVDFYIDRAVNMSSGEGWEGYGNTLKEPIRRNDIEGLKAVLLDPDDDRYRSISPLIMLLMPPEESQAIRKRQHPGVVTPDMLVVD